MTPRLTHLAVVAVALVAVLAGPAVARADTPVSLDEAYRQIKDAERSIPVPTPVTTTSMGTFDAATGSFDGLATETEIINNKPVRIVPQVFINAVNQRLTFQILHSTTTTRVSVTGGGTAIAAAHGTTVTVDAGRLSDVRWSIVSGTKRHSDELLVKRPRFIGAGAFTIPALPVAVVYDPPQDPTGTNSVAYTRSTSIGTTLGITVKNATSTSAPAVSPNFSEVGIFHSQLQGAASFLSTVGEGAASAAITKIDGFLGKATRNVSTTNDNTITQKRTYKFTESHTCATDTGVFHLGPGHGDRVAYLRNVRMVWFDGGASPIVLVLGYDSFECPTIDQLRSGLAGLSPAAAQPLIDLDPFTGPLGAKTPLGADPRFEMLPGIGLLPGLVQTASYQQELIVEHSTSETYTRVVTDDLGAGLLSLVGLAPGQTQQLSSTFSVGTTAEASESTSVTTALTARTLTNGIRTELAVFYDRVFGNIAFQDQRP